MQRERWQRAMHGPSYLDILPVEVDVGVEVDLMGEKGTECWLDIAGEDADARSHKQNLRGAIPTIPSDALRECCPKFRHQGLCQGEDQCT